MAKLTATQPYQVSERTRLFEYLDAGRCQRMVWIVGPPGAGKTMLVSSYIAARSLRTLWYQLDAGDSAIASFFHYLATAIKVIAPRYRKSLPPLTPEYLPGLMILHSDFLNQWEKD